MKVRQRFIPLITAILLSGIAVKGYASEDPAAKLKVSLSAGQTAFFNQNYPKAEQDFKVAAEEARLLGNSKIYAIAINYLGFSQVYLDKPQEAEETLRQAAQFDTPAKSVISKMLNYLAYIEHYSRLGDMETEQRYIEATLAQPDAAFRAAAIPRASLVNQYKAIQIMKKKLADIETPAKSENYINEALLNGKVLHWNDNTHFIKVFISPGNHIQGWNPLYADNFKKACLVWQEALDNKIRFEFVDSKQDPSDIVVNWQADQSMRPATTNYNFYKNTLVKANIAFHLIDNSNQLYVPRTLYKLSLHELGHLLGITGHSKNPDDIMFPASTYATTLSQRDIATMQKLYSRPAEITTPEGMTLSEYRNSIALQGKTVETMFNH